MIKLLFIGSPGSGKGTQAKLLRKYGLYSISPGEVIRKSKDKRIVKYRKESEKGELLPDKIIFEIIKEEIDSLPKKANGYILDGAVRTLKQAKYVKEHDLVNEVVFYKLKKSTAIKRILKRNQGRSDDNPKVIKERFLEYKKNTKPAIKYLKKNFHFYEISAEKTPEEIDKVTVKKLRLK